MFWEEMKRVFFAMREIEPDALDDEIIRRVSLGHGWGLECFIRHRDTASASSTNSSTDTSY